MKLVRRDTALVKNPGVAVYVTIVYGIVILQALITIALCTQYTQFQHVTNHQTGQQGFKYSRGAHANPLIALQLLIIFGASLWTGYQFFALDDGTQKSEPEGKSPTAPGSSSSPATSSPISVAAEVEVEEDPETREVSTELVPTLVSFDTGLGKIPLGVLAPRPTSNGQLAVAVAPAPVREETFDEQMTRKLGLIWELVKALRGGEADEFMFSLMVCANSRNGKGTTVRAILYALYRYLGGECDLIIVDPKMDRPGWLGLEDLPESHRVVYYPTRIDKIREYEKALNRFYERMIARVERQESCDRPVVLLLDEYQTIFEFMQDERGFDSNRAKSRLNDILRRCLGMNMLVIFVAHSVQCEDIGMNSTVRQYLKIVSQALPRAKGEDFVAQSMNLILKLHPSVHSQARKDLNRVLESESQLPYAYCTMDHQVIRLPDLKWVGDEKIATHYWQFHYPDELLPDALKDPQDLLNPRQSPADTGKLVDGSLDSPQNLANLNNSAGDGAVAESHDDIVAGIFRTGNSVKSGSSPELEKFSNSASNAEENPVIPAVFSGEEEIKIDDLFPKDQFEKYSTKAISVSPVDLVKRMLPQEFVVLPRQDWRDKWKKFRQATTDGEMLASDAIKTILGYNSERYRYGVAIARYLELIYGDNEL